MSGLLGLRTPPPGIYGSSALASCCPEHLSADPGDHIMPRRQQWIAPQDDEAVSMEHAFQQNSDDPRALGRGPCGSFHRESVPLMIREKRDTMTWMSNQWARWADCSTCALRLLYFPKHGHIGQFRKQESPPHVDRALHLLRERGLSRTCNHKIMKTFLDMAAAEMKAPGRTMPYQ